MAAIETDQLPAHFTPVSAARRVAKETDNRGEAEQPEDGRVFQGFEHRNLLLRRGRRELLHRWEKLLRFGLDLREPVRESLFLAACKSLQCAIDEIDDAGLARSRRVIRGDDLPCYGVDFDSLLRCEHFKLGRRYRLRRFVRVLCC